MQFALIVLGLALGANIILPAIFISVVCLGLVTINKYLLEKEIELGHDNLEALETPEEFKGTCPPHIWLNDNSGVFKCGRPGCNFTIGSK